METKLTSIKGGMPGMGDMGGMMGGAGGVSDFHTENPAL